MQMMGDGAHKGGIGCKSVLAQDWPEITRDCVRDVAGRYGSGKAGRTTSTTLLFAALWPTARWPAKCPLGLSLLHWDLMV